MLLAYMPDATTGIDPAIDGRYINDCQTALTSIIENEEFTIQGRGEFQASDIVPLGFKSLAAGNFTIAINAVDGLFLTTNQAIYLKDNLTNTIQNLSAGNYDFATEAGVFNARFEIWYENLLATNQPVFNGTNVVVYKQNQELVINAGKTVLSKVQVYDIRGCLLLEKKNCNSNEVRFNVGMTNQVLILKITNGNNEIITKKVVN
jgi:hypothetical protein